MSAEAFPLGDFLNGPKDAADREREERETARRLVFRRALASEAGREMLAHLAELAHLNRANAPAADTALEMAFLEGRRALVLEMMRLASVEISFRFPQFEGEAPRPKFIETENA